MFGIRRKEDVTGATERVFSALRQLYRGERSCVPVVLALREAKEEIELTVRDEDGHAACVRCPACLLYTSYSLIARSAAKRPAQAVLTSDIRFQDF